jgi:transposase
MPKLLAARPPLDAAEDAQVRRLARSLHAPADWVLHARMIARSGDGLRTRILAEELGCHPQTVRERFSAFNDRGRDGLGMKPGSGSGRKPRLSEAERSAVIALLASPPPARLIRYPDGTLAAADSPEGAVWEWSLDALAAAARAQGIQIGRSQVRRILRKEGVRWRRTPSWAQSSAKDFAPKGRRSSPGTRTRPMARRPSAPMSSAPMSSAPMSSAP